MRLIRYADNIIDAMRLYAPDHILLQCLNRDGYACRNTKYVPLTMPDGSIAQVKESRPTDFFRGECQDHVSCKAGLYRGKDRSKRILELLKTYHFICYLKEHPVIREWVFNRCYVDYWMLAQHYEFMTPLLDLTDEISTAAFFATHRYDRVIKDYVVKEDGVGIIRHYKGELRVDGTLRPVGVQPMARPSQQDGVALWLDAEDDFADLSDKVVFKQDRKINLQLKRAMLGGTDFFPPEPVTMMAATIREGNLMTSNAIEAMLHDIDEGVEYIKPVVSEKEIVQVLKDNDYHIVDTEMISYMVPPNPDFHKIRKVLIKPAWRSGKRLQNL